MEDIRVKQQMLRETIERALVNFKKAGRANQTPAKIRSRISNLTTTWEKFQDGHVSFVLLCPDQEKDLVDYFKDDHFSAVEEVYSNTLDVMNEALESLEPPSPTSPPAMRSSLCRSSPAPPVVPLPPIRMTPFDGRLEEWESFRDQFTTLVRDNQDISDFTKMHYLASSVSHSAHECIKHLPITADNFQVAWNALTARFENKRRLLTKLVTDFFAIPPVSRENADELQLLLDRASSIIAALKRMGRDDATLLDDVFTHVVAQKTDPVTRKAWVHRAKDGNELPSYKDLEAFLSSRVCALQEWAPTTHKPSSKAPVSRVHVATTPSSTKGSCPLCKSAHFLQKCPRYLCLSASERRDVAVRFKRCLNCLSTRHSLSECPSKFTCQECRGRHHTSLHGSSQVAHVDRAAPRSPVEPASTATNDATALQVSVGVRKRRAIVLGTAYLLAGVLRGRSAVIRALIDPGSELTFVSEHLAQILRADRIRLPTPLHGIACTPSGTARHAVHLAVANRARTGPVFSTVALVLDSLTAYSPKQLPPATCLSHLADLTWADDDPASSHRIDLIIGADLYNDVLLTGVRKGNRGEPVAQETIFGWVITGPREPPICPVPDDQEWDFMRDAPPSALAYHCVTSPSLDEEVRRFWELEELPRSQVMEPGDAQSEAHFRETHSRDSSGRYIVRLPFKIGPPINIGRSRETAEKLARSISRRLSRDTSLEREYRSFMEEYERLGHMRAVSSLPTPPVSTAVYIPHHPVLRSASATSRLRVVFNASCRTSDGTSLNDHLLTGPKLQRDLTAIILRWRRWRYVCSADIAKMYRQILVDPRDVDYQRILWLSEPSSSLKEFQLLTVTYGMACAPFLALRVLQQLAEDDGDSFPLARENLLLNTYVDDVLFRADDVDSLRLARQQSISLLSKGGFTLRKWASNSSRLLADVDESDHGLACDKVLSADESLKVLGIVWSPHRDAFSFSVLPFDREPITKRAVLSVIARLYDPLGWVTPVVIKAKLVMQDLWRSKVGWDDPVPPPILREWAAFSSDLNQLNLVKIPRWTQLSSSVSSIELHGFADASSSAYAASVYLRVVSESNHITVSLLAGKSKVAPLTPMTIPRLELNAAVLLARLISFTVASMAFGNVSVTCWSDSTVVLHWISQHPSRWKIFVGNRVARIQELVPSAAWRYVPTSDNPADVASRGIFPTDILTHSLWWRGPPWLREESGSWPTPPPNVNFDSHLEEKVTAVLQCSPVPPMWDLSARYSSWDRLIRITALVIRFGNRCRRREDMIHTPTGSVHVTTEEYDCSRNFWLRCIQREVFPSEFPLLSSRKQLPPKHPLLSLRSFVSADNLIRVGGRLRHAPLSFESRHPILLSAHPLVDLLLLHVHQRALHAGPQLTLSILRREYWLLRARGIVRRIIHSCVPCTRERAAVPRQLMGDLPRVRVTPPSRSFLHSGVDYAGPVWIRSSPGRGAKSRKAYIALFVCLASKAIHLELVSDYSSEAFIGAFYRFCSRRGIPEAMYSDNGTTFVGADREMTKAYRAALRDSDFLNSTVSDRISWHFIPPSAPHFGGLWEAGVRSVKTHLSRVVGDRTLTFEELSTLLCRIEACLNSRPLCPLSDTLDDLDCLTPGHFTIGAAIVVPPEPSILDLNENRLSRWQLVRQMNERFWRIWQSDYVNTLQQRTKWRTDQPPVEVGRMVLLRNASLPPAKWELGRVVQVHPGHDNVTRVVTLKTARAEYKRPIGKLCLLPVWSASKDSPSPP